MAHLSGLCIEETYLVISPYCHFFTTFSTLFKPLNLKCMFHAFISMKYLYFNFFFISTDLYLTAVLQ